MKHIFRFGGVGIYFKTKRSTATFTGLRLRIEAGLITHKMLFANVSLHIALQRSVPPRLFAQSYILMFSEPKLRVRDLSQRPRVPGRYLDMLACHRLLKQSVDAPEVNENIWFLPDLFTSRLGHMSWQVTRVQRRIGDRSGGLLLFFHTGHNPETRMNMFLA